MTRSFWLLCSRDRTPSPRRPRAYESDRRATARSLRRSRSLSGEAKRSPVRGSRSVSRSPGRAKGSPRSKDPKISDPAIEGISSALDGTGMLRNRGKEVDIISPVKIDKVGHALTDKVKITDNGNIVDTVFKVDSNTENKAPKAKLDTASMLKDLEDKTRQHPSTLEALRNAVLLEPESGLETKGFKKPAKRGSKDRSFMGDEETEDAEPVIIDDWRDDIKEQGREKPRSKEKKERAPSKKSKDGEERVAVDANKSLPGVDNDVYQNGKYVVMSGDVSKHVEIAITSPYISTEKRYPELQENERRSKEKTLQEQHGKVNSLDDSKNANNVVGDRWLKGTNSESSTYFEDVRVTAERTYEVGNYNSTEDLMLGPETLKKGMQTSVSKKLVSTNTFEDRYQDATMERVAKVLVAEESRVEVDKFPEKGLGKSEDLYGKYKSKSGEEIDEEEHYRKGNRKTKVLHEEDEDHERKRRRKSRAADTEAEDQEQKGKKNAEELDQEEEEFDIRASRGPQDLDEEEEDRRIKKKTQEVGEDPEDQERRKERHRQHRKKHRHEDDPGRDDDGEETEEGDSRKERRRHKKKHKKDEDVDKRERKQRKHKRHRKRRSPAESPELSPSGGTGKSKRANDDSIVKHKHHRWKRTSESRERSPSADADKVRGFSHEGGPHKKSSSRHKKKRRDQSKSDSDSPSSSD